MPNGYLTTDEAAKRLGYHPDHLRRLVRQGKVPAAERLHRIYLFPDTISRADITATTRNR